MIYRTRRFTLDTSDLTVRDAKGDAARLYNKDYELLKFLCERTGEAVSADDILEAVWDRNADYSSNVVASSVSNARRTLGKDAVLTVRNRYMVEAADVPKRRKAVAIGAVASVALAAVAMAAWAHVPGARSVVVSSVDGINPPGNDNEHLDREYVALKNVSGAAVDLSGWTVSDETGHSYRFAKRVLPPGAELRLVTGKCLDDAATACWDFPGGYAVWNNDKDAAFVRDPD